MTIPNINTTYKNFKRLRQILTVLGKHGFSQVIESAGLSKHIPFKKAPAPEIPRKSIQDRLCLAFEELGPTFVKLGQMFASRPDIFSPEFSKAFERLRDDVKPVSFKDVRKVLEDELDEKTETVFKAITEKPMAAASIAQVHEALLHDDSKAVIKIQRPGIQKEIETDLSILFLLAKMAERYIPELKAYDPVAIVDEFSKTIKSAMDFIEEAHNIDEIAGNFKENPNVHFPEIHWELTSKRVLTMQKIEGIPIHNIEKLKSENHDLRKICETGVNAFFQQVFIDGVFHADLHGGNIFVLPESRIAFIDFGEVGRIGTNAQTAMASIFVSLITKDFFSLAKQYVDLGKPQEIVDISRFADDLEKFLEPMFRRKIKDMDVGEVLTKAAAIAAKYHIRLPRELVLIGRVIVTMEELIRQLDPEFDVLESGGKFAMQAVKDKFKPEKLAKDLVWNLRDFSEMSRELPSHLKYLVQKLSNNELTIRVDMKHLKNGVEEMDRASNRMAFAIVIGGLIIGSSILTYGEAGPKYFNIPLFGLIGYVLAGFIGLGLLFSILRSRRL